MDKISEDFLVEQDITLEKLIMMIKKKPAVISYIIWNSWSLFDD